MRTRAVSNASFRRVARRRRLRARARALDYKRRCGNDSDGGSRVAATAVATDDTHTVSFIVCRRRCRRRRRRHRHRCGGRCGRSLAVLPPFQRRARFR